MVVRALVWLGTRTARLDEMRTFWRNLLGSNPTVDTPERAVFVLPSGDRVELSKERDHRHFTSGPVAGFLVDDLAATITRLETLGAELLPPASADNSEVHWTHFRAPDGNVYEVTERTVAPTGLPPLAAEDFSCTVCGIDYPAVSVAAALTAIEQQPGRLCAMAMTIPDGVLRTRPDPGTWSALE
jgi:glyoxylase I family protein